MLNLVRSPPRLELARQRIRDKSVSAKLAAGQSIVEKDAIYEAYSYLQDQPPTLSSYDKKKSQNTARNFQEEVWMQMLLAGKGAQFEVPKKQ